MKVDLQALIMFASVARTRSFSRSAGELGVAQPWLSARIRRLEARLGFSLFERTTRQVSLTPEGGRLLPHAEMLALSARAIEAAASEIGAKQSGRLRIGSPPFLSRNVQRIELMDSFAARTGVTIEIDIGWTGRLLDRLKRGDLDAAFLVEPFEPRRLETLYFCSMAMVMFVRQGHPLSGQQTLSPPMLSGQRIGTFVRALNPGLFDALYSPLRDAGAMIVEVPEVRRSILEISAPLKLDMLSTIEPAPFRPRKDVGDVAKLPVDGVPHLSLRLVRRDAANTICCNRFWETAQAMLGNHSPAGEL